jgi:hypothetical protein
MRPTEKSCPSAIESAIFRLLAYSLNWLVCRVSQLPLYRMKNVKGPNPGGLVGLWGVDSTDPAFDKLVWTCKQPSALGGGGGENVLYIRDK